MLGCHAEQLEFLAYGLRFARFYFRTISLPDLSNENQSSAEPWRHARVHAIRCTHRWKSPPPPCIITEWPPLSIHVINVMFRQSNNSNMSTLYLTPPPPPIWESKPLVAIDNLEWAISLRKLNRDSEGFVNNWRPNPFHTYTRRFCVLLRRGSQLSTAAQS